MYPATKNTGDDMTFSPILTVTTTITEKGKVRLCSHVDKESGEQCTKYARKGGMCTIHGSNQQSCAFEGCMNIVGNNGKWFLLFY